MAMSKKIVQTIINENKNEKVVLIAEYISAFKPIEMLWQGMLYDIPDKYKNLEVDNFDWLSEKNCWLVIVYI